MNVGLFGEPVTQEERIEWVPTTDPPEGWRFGHNDYSEKDGTMAALYLSPDWPEGRKHVWIELRRVRLVRHCTEWREV